MTSINDPWDELQRLSDEASAAWKSDKSALEILMEDRRGEVADVEQLMAGDKLGLAILEAIELKGFPARRIIVDCETGNAAMIYIEAFVSDKILKLNWTNGLKGAEVKILDKGGKDGDGCR